MDSSFELLTGIAAALLFPLLLWYHESDHMWYHLRCLFRPSKNKAGLPTPSHIRRTVLSLIETMPSNTYTLVDFGCGDGDLIEHVRGFPRITNMVGIELDAEQAETAAVRFTNDSRIQIRTMDMRDYVFAATGDKVGDTVGDKVDDKVGATILYIYEPLWGMDAAEARGIYQKVMDHVLSTKGPFYILYVSGVRSLLDEAFFAANQCVTLHHSRARRFLGWNANHIYLFKVA
jgi:hypothetical protein